MFILIYGNFLHILFIIYCTINFNHYLIPNTASYTQIDVFYK